MPEPEPEPKPRPNYLNDWWRARQMSFGMLLLGIWLILYGLIALLALSFQGIGIMMGVLALIAGILLLVGR